MIRSIFHRISLLFCLALLLFCGACILPASYEEAIEGLKFGAIEAHYINPGPYPVKSYYADAEIPVKKITCRYPGKLIEGQERWPVVLLVNGTNIIPAYYDDIFKHLASWGFIVLGNNDRSAWSGKSSDLTLDWLLKENQRKGSIFYGKVDTERIGISGHSQGGIGMFNAITRQTHKGLYKVAVALSPVNEYTAEAISMPYDSTQVKIPLLMAAGTESSFETKLVSPLKQMQRTYSRMKVPRIMLRRLNCDHVQSLYQIEGYVTAWFMWQLKNDSYAAKAFSGNAPEILGNESYVNQQIDLQ